jgi:carbon-monoxide dehydrogenase medium subunit
MPMLALRVALLDILVDISRLDDLKIVTRTPDSVWLGSLTTHAAIEDGETPDIFNGLMRHVAGQISYRAVRNHGTIGGSVALGRSRRRLAVLPPCTRAASLRVVGRERHAHGARRRFHPGFLRDDAHHRRHHHGLRHPGAESAFRWGFAKVARKSGAFAHSIAIARRRQGRPDLGRARRRRPAPRPMPRRRHSCDSRQLGGTVARRHRGRLSTRISPTSTPIKSDCTRRTSCAP